jgi:NAD(P)-dependent dehydrogenase (short-subunit alcohol dehydrogenase family)
VIITGAGSGIGLAITRAFTAERANVLAADVAPGAAVGERVVTLEIDLTQPDAGQRATDAALEAFGAVDVLVNNVGVAYPRDGFLSVSDDDWRSLIEVNFMSMVRASRAAIPHMVKQGKGALVNIASDAGHIPAPIFVDYCVTKVAIRMLSKAIANEFASAGIRSNCVSPGPTRTHVWEQGAMIEALMAESGLDREATITRFLGEVRGMPMARLGEPEDVAVAVVFLASDLAGQVSGADYRVDGGQIPNL